MLSCAWPEGARKLAVAAQANKRHSDDLPNDQASIFRTTSTTSSGSSHQADAPVTPTEVQSLPDPRPCERSSSDVLAARRQLLFKTTSLPAACPDWFYAAAAYQSQPGRSSGIDEATALLEALEQRRLDEEQDLALSLSHLPLGCDWLYDPEAYTKGCDTDALLASLGAL